MNDSISHFRDWRTAALGRSVDVLVGLDVCQHRTDASSPDFLFDFGDQRMLRCFVAIPLPDEIKERLVALQPSPTAGIRLIGAHEMHLTVHFIGALINESRDLVRRALGQITMSPFTIAIRGLGTFPTEGAPKVLWSGVEHDPALLELHRSVGLALTDAIGFQVEKRPYSPHITLARLNGSVSRRRLESHLNEFQELYIPSIGVTHFTLYSSHVVDGAPEYREEAVFEF